jgi:N,N'-diacetyllegionaminate synthase
MDHNLIIADRQIGDGKSTFIVAEAGLNHNGRLGLAKKMITAAVEAKADAIKFQTYKSDDFVGRSNPYYKLFKKCELSFSDFAELSDISKSEGIIFMSTPLDYASVDFLESLHVPCFKIASGDITNLPFLRYVAKKSTPLILSTGISTLEEVSDAYEAVKSVGNNDIALLHCISNYPAAYENVNLRAISSLKNAFDVPVGFSDHTQNSLTSLIAVALGACIIEKHFTLNKKLKGPDHSCSFTPKEVSKLVMQIRQIELMLGFEEKKPIESEIPLRSLARRSIFAKNRIAKGTKITEKMLAYRRPGDGISPTDSVSVVGRRAKFDIESDEKIVWEKLE